MSVRFFVASDTTVRAVGGEAVVRALAEAVAGEENIEIVRNGSRGAFWLEPLLEVESDGQRFAFGPVTPADVADIVKLCLAYASGGANPSYHPLYLGALQDHPWFAGQQRLTFARAGLGDPLCIDTYLSLGGFAGLKRALQLTQTEIVDELIRSGLRGRGGAAFPAGIKWQTVQRTDAAQKYVVCNADEGDSGTFADRLLMEADPYQLIEGMVIAGLAVGADRGYIYLRSEYPYTRQIMAEAIERATQAGYLGEDICNSGNSFELVLRIGAGAYICGEETALLESLEGRRGMVRAKPPLPAIEGLFGQPTVVNNVLTLAAATTVLADGAEAYAALGQDRSTGTLTLQLAGNIKHGGLVEIPFGTSLREVVETYGGGTHSGRPARAIQVGGPLGAYLPADQWDLPLTYEVFAEAGAMLGHGGVVVFDDSVDMAQQARFAMAFCAEESCGKCTPCRVGSVRGVEVMDKIIAREAPEENLALLADLCDTMALTSLCAMGGLTPTPVRSALEYFPQDFR